MGTEPPNRKSTMASYAKLLALAATPALFDAASAGGPVCNWQCYLDRYPDLQDAFGAANTASARIHYHNHGQSEGRDCTCPVVDETCDWQCYLDRYPDLQDALGAANTASARIHYHNHGQSEGRDCTCPKASKLYIIGEQGENGCPSGYDLIASETECRAAATAVGEEFFTTGNWATSPAGCFYSKLDGAFFNAHPTGSAHTRQATICKIV